MERVDKDENRAFYDTQREDDRRRFEQHPSKAFLTEALVPWVVRGVSAGARIVDSGRQRLGTPRRSSGRRR
jgi:hypothetical protein